MLEKSFNYIYEKAKQADKVVIVGAGKRGRKLMSDLQKSNAIYLEAFFDNNETIVGTIIEGVKIVKPYKIDGICIYIIAVDAREHRKAFLDQLQELGIEKENIVIYYYNRDYDYLSSLKKENYKEEIQDMYYEKFGKRINWQNPITYNEKINWEKLNIRDEKRTRLVDKYLVKTWVKEQIGEKYLTKLYGVWDNADEIDFDTLPNQFVLKLNNGSGRNIIVKDKREMNQDEICRQLEEWKGNNFAFASLELQYKDIVPKIICEEYLDGVAESVYDYNIYCFHGEPVYIWCIKGSHRPGCQASFYNKDWEMQPFSYGYPQDPIPAPKPEKLEEMLALSRILCKEFRHVRVDWYNLPDGRVLFGEMTFSTWSGLMHFEPEEYDFIFGKLI
ncbi:MAG: hypothetical protein HFI63_11900 [Lachnospiraceae bacterium]|nr:hypothetical protein [Lachnospiraceae bacterium]